MPVNKAYSQNNYPQFTSRFLPEFSHQKGFWGFLAKTIYDKKLLA